MVETDSLRFERMRKLKYCKCIATTCGYLIGHKGKCANTGYCSYQTKSKS